MNKFKMAAVTVLAASAIGALTACHDEPGSDAGASTPSLGVAHQDANGGGYDATCGPDGSVKTYWPKTDAAYGRARRACAKVPDLGNQIGNELARQGYPGWSSDQR